MLDSQKSYSNRFHSSGGNAAYSVMANTLRGIYGSDVLIATGNSFTGNVLKAGYTEKMAGDMIMPNGLAAYSLWSVVFQWRSGKRMMVIH